LYKGSLQDKNTLEYTIEIYESELDEKKIEEFLNTRVNKRAILKSVIVHLKDNLTTSGEDIYHMKNKDSSIEKF